MASITPSRTLEWASVRVRLWSLKATVVLGRKDKPSIACANPETIGTSRKLPSRKCRRTSPTEPSIIQVSE